MCPGTAALDRMPELVTWAWPPHRRGLLVRSSDRSAHSRQATLSPFSGGQCTVLSMALPQLLFYLSLVQSIVLLLENLT